MIRAIEEIHAFFDTNNDENWKKWYRSLEGRSWSISVDDFWNIFADEETLEDFRMRALCVLMAPNQPEFYPKNWDMEDLCMHRSGDFRYDHAIPLIDGVRFADMAITLACFLSQEYKKTAVDTRKRSFFSPLYGWTAIMARLVQKSSQNSHFEIFKDIVANIEFISVKEKNQSNAFGIFEEILTSEIPIEEKFFFDELMRAYVLKQEELCKDENFGQIYSAEWHYAIRVQQSQYNYDNEEKWRFDKTLYKSQLEFLLNLPKERRLRAFHSPWMSQLLSYFKPFCESTDSDSIMLGIKNLYPFDEYTEHDKFPKENGSVSVNKEMIEMFIGVLQKKDGGFEKEIGYLKNLLIMNQKAIDLSKILEMKEKEKHQKKKEQRKKEKDALRAMKKE